MPRLHTIDEFRRLLRVSRMTFYRLMRTGAIPAPFYVVNQFRFRADDIDQWFESKKKRAPQQ